MLPSSMFKGCKISTISVQEIDDKGNVNSELRNINISERETAGTPAMLSDKKQILWNPIFKRNLQKTAIFTTMQFREIHQYLIML